MLDEGYDIDCHAIVVGPTATERLDLDVSMTQPTPRTLVRSTFRYAGTGVRTVAAYWGHDYLMSLCATLPESFAENFARNFTKTVIEKEKKEMEAEAKRQ